MFERAQIQLDRSFAVVDKQTPIAEIKSKLREYNFVVVTGGTYFIIGNYEYEIIALGAESASISDWLQKLSWLPSAPASAGDMPYATDWRRPVLWLEGDAPVGIMTEAAWINMLKAENRQTTAYFQTLAETINDSVTAVNEEGIVVCWNTTAEETYKIKKADIIGEKISTHFRDESIVLQHILNEGYPVRGQYHRPNADTHVLINATPVILDNRIIGGIASEHDITKMIRLNEELDSASTLLVQKINPFLSFDSSSPKFQESLTIAQKMAHADIPVLITGETGSGKEMLAQAIHYGGSKATGPFVNINCSIIPPALLEIELFGIEKASFTEDKQNIITGKIEQALNGTVFIENIDKMPLFIQEKLLTYLVENSFYRVGGLEPITSPTRIIVSASSSVENLLKDGELNEKLFYKLSVIHIYIPPLRTRKEDISALVERSIDEFSAKYKKAPPSIGEEVMAFFSNYDWPGNVRELRSIVERVIVLHDTDRIGLEHLPETLIRNNTDETVMSSSSSISKMDEAQEIEEALRKTYGNKSAAANLLGISRGTLYNKLKEYGLS